MTNKEKKELKRFAKEKVSEYLEVNIPMNQMTLLECHTAQGKIEYVMFEDRRDGREYQTTLGGAECVNEEKILHKELMDYGEIIKKFDTDVDGRYTTIRIFKMDDVLYWDEMYNGEVVEVKELS